ncbi:flagellar filament capping protein FliD [Mariprofundus sp. NF]|uniref:flagellar filament capping protein FliD n=1 Tax=Mariprofundus sp. NF TaxID=2608716 RepID=UPI0015A4CAD7|nr:flagellar filament capping protein FliD [Mariprofundus sp. NF]NWF38576.1 flagellar filament capping protein FliD [Mariprofundus sp. NF]
MANTISSQVTGIAGFDTAAAVEGLLSFQKLEISLAQSKQENELAKQEALTNIRDSLSNFRNTATSMANKNEFFGYTASLSSDSATVTASTLLDVSGTNSVSAGQHTIIVEQLAQAERLSSSAAVKDNTGTAATSDSTALNLSGTFDIEGATVTVAVGDSLQDIAANINQANSGAAATGVTASVVKVSDSDFRLTLVADATGATGYTLSGVDLDAAGTLANLQLGAVGQANQRQTVQTAQDAQISVDGLTLTRSSNTISDVLSGVTFTLKQSDPTVSINMTIGVDETSLRDSVQSFVDGYNSVQTLINEQFQFDEATGQSGVLSGEALLRNLQNSLSATLLQTVPGLASDRNSLVSIGVEPDQYGQLSINDNLFAPIVASDPNTIRDLFVANGSSTNINMQFLIHGDNSTSGTYSVNVTQAATQASVTGSADLSVALASDQTVTLTETNSARQAVVNLTAGQTQSAIITALNSEFQRVATEQHKLSTALTVGGSPATASNLFNDLALGVAVGDTVSITGTTRTGLAVNSSYTVLDPISDTISGLLSAIQSAYNQQVVASLDVNGNIQITDIQSGDSQLSIALTANNEGGGTLAFGTDSVVTEGRYAMNMEAVVSGNGVKIQSAAYGSSSGFSIAQSVDGLGIADQAAVGLDVEGTINGLSATGKGQLLQGSDGIVDGMGVYYTGATTGVIDLTVGIGIGARFDGQLSLFTNPITGLFQNREQASMDIYTTLSDRIANMEELMASQREALTRQFTQMQQVLSGLQASGDFITAIIDAQNAGN